MAREYITGVPHSTIKHKSHMLDKRAVPAPCASAAAGWWLSAPSFSPPPSACWAWWPSVRPGPPPPCPDIRCGRKTHRHVWVLEDSKFVFQTQRRKVPLYQDNTRCSVRAAPPTHGQARYTPWGNCTSVGFTCDKVALRAEGGQKCRGDYLALKGKGDSKTDKFVLVWSCVDPPAGTVRA